MIAESVWKEMRLDGIAVDWVRGGSAVELAPQNQMYDATLLDLALPEKGGLEALKTLRHSKARDSIPNRIYGLDCAHYAFIITSFDPNELAARIRAVLRRQARSAESITHAGALTLNPPTREVQRSPPSPRASSRC